MKQPKLGEIYAIPLSNGVFGFARIFLQGTFGIVDCIAAELPKPKWISQQKVAFWVASFERPTADGTWKLLGRVPFDSLDDAWPPPYYHRDGKDPLFFEINYRNERRSGGLSDIAGLEPCKLWSEEMIRDRIQSQIVERQPWDIRAHCPYCRGLEAEYGPDYEQVIATKFRHPTRRRLEYPPGTLIDAIDLDFYVQHLLKGNKSQTIVIEFMTAEAAERRDEVEDLIDSVLADADLGGVVGAGSMPSPEPGNPYCDLQLEVYKKQKALSLVKRVLKQTALQDVTRIVIAD